MRWTHSLLFANALIAASLALTAQQVLLRGSDGLWICLPIVQALAVVLLYTREKRHTDAEQALQRQLHAARRRLEQPRPAVAHAPGVLPEPPSNMRAAIQSGDAWISVEVLGADAHAQTFRCRSGAVELPVGAEGTIQLRAGLDTSTFRIIVVHRAEKDGSVFYTTRFHEAEQGDYAKEPIFRHLTVRREPRITPERSLPVLVDVRFGEEEYSGCAVDISPSGVAVRLPLSRAEISALGCDVELVIDLPEEDGVFTVAGELRNIQPCSKGVRAGILLTFAKGDDKHKRLRDFVEGLREDSAQVQVTDPKKQEGRRGVA